MPLSQIVFCYDCRDARERGLVGDGSFGVAGGALNLRDESIMICEGVARAFALMRMINRAGLFFFFGWSGDERVCFRV